MKSTSTTLELLRNQTARMFRILSIYSLLTIIHLSHAQQTNQTSPNEIVGWQSEPRTRGTWSILWGCLATLALCVHAVHHVPIRFNKTLISLIGFRIVWYTVGLLFPEFMAMVAWQQWHYACKLTRKMEEIRKVRMARSELVPDYLNEWCMSHSFFVIMGGLCIFKGGSNREDRAYITADGVVTLVLERQDAAMAVVTKETIEDRSKVDGLGKLLTVIQVVHMVVLVSARLLERRTITALEVTTCGYIPIALLQLSFWWHKPFNVQDSIVLAVTNSAVNQLDAGHYDGTFHQTGPKLDEIVFTIYRPTVFGLDGEIGNATTSKYPRWSLSMMFLASSLVAGLHLSLWNAHFPTLVEQWMWRGTSIANVAAGLLLALGSIYGYDGPLSTSSSQEGSTSTMARPNRLVRGWHVLIELTRYTGRVEYMTWFCRARDFLYVLIYLVARLYIIVECFAGLRSLPADAYIVPEWTSILPNFS